MSNSIHVTTSQSTFSEAQLLVIHAHWLARNAAYGLDNQFIDDEEASSILEATDVELCQSEDIVLQLNYDHEAKTIVMGSLFSARSAIKAALAARWGTDCLIGSLWAISAACTSTGKLMEKLEKNRLSLNSKTNITDKVAKVDQ